MSHKHLDSHTSDKNTTPPEWDYSNSYRRDESIHNGEERGIAPGVGALRFPGLSHERSEHYLTSHKVQIEAADDLTHGFVDEPCKTCRSLQYDLFDKPWSTKGNIQYSLPLGDTSLRYMMVTLDDLEVSAAFCEICLILWRGVSQFWDLQADPDEGGEDNEGGDDSDDSDVQPQASDEQVPEQDGREHLKIKGLCIELEPGRSVVVEPIACKEWDFWRANVYEPFLQWLRWTSTSLEFFGHGGDCQISNARLPKHG